MDALGIRVARIVVPAIEQDGTLLEACDLIVNDGWRECAAPFYFGDAVMRLFACDFSGGLAGEPRPWPLKSLIRTHVEAPRGRVSVEIMDI